MPTFGSQTIKRGGGQLRQAAAQAKATPLTIADGVIAARNGAGKKLTFAEALSAVQAAIANAIFNALGVCAQCRSPGADQSGPHSIGLKTLQIKKSPAAFRAAGPCHSLPRC